MKEQNSWKVIANDTTGFWDVFDSLGTHLVEVESESIARLIATVPDMLSALKAIQYLLHFGEPSKAAKVVVEVLGKIEQS